MSDHPLFSFLVVQFCWSKSEWKDFRRRQRKESLCWIRSAQVGFRHVRVAATPVPLPLQSFSLSLQMSLFFRLSLSFSVQVFLSFSLHMSLFFLLSKVKSFFLHNSVFFLSSNLSFSHSQFRSFFPSLYTCLCSFFSLFLIFLSFSVQVFLCQVKSFILPLFYSSVSTSWLTLPT